MKIYVLLICLIYSLSGWSIGSNTKLDWHEIETEHFYIVYDNKSLGKDIYRYAAYAELAYEYLDKIYKDKPDKTVLVFSDNTDVANGYATFLPYPLIKIFPVVPQAGDSINHYDNWMYEVILHEYAHILTFESGNGFYYPLRYIFGGVVKPNALLPLWYHEGSAVVMESYFTQSGRLRSPLYGAQIRALSMDNKLLNETLDQINDPSIPDWPYGQRPYFLGSLLVNEVVNRKDLNIIGELNYSYSRRLPFLIHNPLEERIGIDFEDLQTEVYKSVSESAQKQIEQIESDRTYKEQSLNLPGTSQTSPKISPDGTKLIYREYDKYVSHKIVLVERNENGEFFPAKKFNRLFKIDSNSQFNWSPDSKKIVYNKIGTINRFNSFFDLYEYNLENKKTTRLTTGARAFQASYAPNGKSLVYVKNYKTATGLMLLNLSSKKIRRLVKPRKNVRLGHPYFVDDGKVAYLKKNRTGSEYFKLYNIKSKKHEKTAAKGKNFRKMDSSNGALLLVDDKSGTQNISLFKDLFKTPQPITNTLTQINGAAFDESKNTLIIDQLTSNGSQLFAINNVTPQTRTPLDPLVKIGPTKASEYLDRYKKVRESIKYKPEEYSGLSYLMPKYWIPFVYPVDGGSLLQGSTTAADPVGHHSLALQVSYDTVTQRGSYSVGYLNSATKLNYLFQYSLNNSYISASQSVVTDAGSLFSAGFYPPGLSTNYTASAGFKQIDTSNSATKYKRMGPTLSMSYNRLGDDIFLGGGLQYSLSYTNYLEMDQHTSYERMGFFFDQYMDSFLPKRHQMLFQIKSSYSPGLLIQDVLTLGDKTVNGNYLASLLSSSFMMRGYPSGGFIGSRMINTNLEYKFPLFDIFSGFIRIPFFLKKIQGNLFVDSLNLEGAFYNSELRGYQAVRADRNFLAYGFEMKVSTTIGWHLPMDLIIGAHYGTDKIAGGGEVVPFFGVGISGFGDFSKTSKFADLSR